MWIQSLGSGRYSEGAHGNPLQYPCWRIPWAEESDRLQSIGSKKVAHGWTYLACICAGFARLTQVFENTNPCTDILMLVILESVYKNKHSSVQFSRTLMSNSLRPHEPQHARPPRPSPTPRVYPNSCPSSRWCHPAISSSVVLFSSCP